jgi:hypothetical protein
MSKIVQAALARRAAPCTRASDPRRHMNRLRARSVARALVDPDFVLVPWDAAEETAEDEAKAGLDTLVARFAEVDKDGCAALDVWPQEASPLGQPGLQGLVTTTGHSRRPRQPPGQAAANAAGPAFSPACTLPPCTAMA